VRWQETSSLATLQESELLAVARGVGGAQRRKGGGLALRPSCFPKVHRRRRRRVIHGYGVRPRGHSHDGGASLPSRSGPPRPLGGGARRPLRGSDDGRLQSSRPGAGAAEKGLPRPLASRRTAPRLKEAARAGSGGRREITHPHSLPRDRRRRETGVCGAGARPPEPHGTVSRPPGERGRSALQSVLR